MNLENSLGFYDSAWAAGTASAEKVKLALEQVDLPTKLKTDGVGDPKLSGTYDGIKYAIIFHNCTNHSDCEAIQFLAGFSEMPEPLPARAINAWNTNHLIGRVFIDGEGDPGIDAVFVLRGATTESIGQYGKYWKMALDEFALKLGFSR